MTESALTATTGSYLMPVFGMEQAIERYNRLVSFVRQVMKPGVDYGTIPGATKPTLLKPGAERLTTYFGLTPRFVTVKETEDWTGHANGGEPFFYYWFRCQLWRGEILVAEADGSCNSHEKKYRYRQGERLCPKCSKATIRKSKDERGGWYCWAKLGGCGAKFANGDQAIEGQDAGQILNPDIADQTNTILKMAQKRALIAATLMAVNASEFFTQDLEDLDIIEGHYAVIETPVPAKEEAKGPTWTPDLAKPADEPPVPEPPKPAPANVHSARPLSAEAVVIAVRKKAGWKGDARPYDDSVQPASDGQVTSVVSLLSEAVKRDGLTQTAMDNDRHAVLAHLFRVKSTKDLSSREASAMIDWLKVSGENWDINQYAAAEVAAVLVAWQESQGQQALL